MPLHSVDPDLERHLCHAPGVLGLKSDHAGFTAVLGGTFSACDNRRAASSNGSMPDDRQQHHYVATIVTLEHPDTAYVAVGRKGGASAWFITTDPSKAFDFGNGVEARKVVDPQGRV